MLHLADIGPRRGTYVLVIRLHRRVIVGSSRLRNWEVLPGLYLYVGSALGPGGLRARLSHHLRTNARFHWHVDHLTHSGNIDEIWYTLHPQRWEHDWAGTLAGLSGTSIACPRFGASDCGCATHLYHLRRKPAIASFRRLLTERFPDHPQVSIFAKKGAKHL